eukprot:4172294-Amphidinium_carterae.1
MPVATLLQVKHWQGRSFCYIQNKHPITLQCGDCGGFGALSDDSNIQEQKCQLVLPSAIAPRRMNPNNLKAFWARLAQARVPHTSIPTPLYC